LNWGQPRRHADIVTFESQADCPMESKFIEFQSAQAVAYFAPIDIFSGADVQSLKMPARAADSRHLLLPQWQYSSLPAITVKHRH